MLGQTDIVLHIDYQFLTKATIRLSELERKISRFPRAIPEKYIDQIVIQTLGFCSILLSYLPLSFFIPTWKCILKYWNLLITVLSARSNLSADFQSNCCRVNKNKLTTQELSNILLFDTNAAYFHSSSTLHHILLLFCNGKLLLTMETKQFLQKRAE